MDYSTSGYPCPSPSPGVHPNSCPSSQWCHPTISSSVFPFSSCLQSCPASGSFPVSRLFASGGQSIGASASAVSPSNEHSGLISFRIDWFDQKRVFAITSVFSWQNSVTFLYSKAKLAYYSRYLLTSYFCIPVPCDEKDIFWGVSSRRSCRSS